ncbi:FAS1-like dehydratase domain-containing protein [Nonomuraea cavernae]|uniref:FAS1-like dehydratase domain-containing protein n=1 Tax=Nonomuraea cavernae TaxID=2045107 RepID=UPI0033EA1187
MTLLTEDIRALVGRRKVYTAPEEFGAAAGRYFGLAIGDLNPLYSDPEYARAQGLAGVTAPPTLICETNQYANLPLTPDGDAGHNWGIEIAGTRKVRGGNSYTFHRRIRPEDVITATWEIADATEKTTRSGSEMLIITSRATYTDQHDEVLAENEETIIFVSLEPGASGAGA